MLLLRNMENLGLSEEQRKNPTGIITAIEACVNGQINEFVNDVASDIMYSRKVTCSTTS